MDAAAVAIPPTVLWREALAEADRLLALEPGARAAALVALQATRPAHARRVMDLIAEPTGATFEVPSEWPAAAVAPGQAIGPWRLTGLAGRGGMGEVWRAERTDGRFEGAAAIKLLRTGPAGWNERFRREGQVLARLVHPHIARLLDAGTLPAGQPYLVLEFIDGQRIDAWCDERRLTLAGRVDLVLQVCDAVAHAHANLVVHRDLKPSNILVTPEGRAVLLDFGIAKLVQAGDDGEATALTHDGGHAMTPEYAAPEQVQGGPVTTATDVHALGLLLYRLLSGRRPYGAGDTTPATPLQWAQALQAEPVPLSAAAVDVQAAAARGTTPERLRRLLAGDLETIVAKAIRKEPAQRYAGVQALADDLRRWRRHEPVLARPAGWAYRTRRFVQRNATLSVVLALLVLVLAIGGGATAWQAVEARRQAARAEAEAAKLREVTAFIVGALEVNRGDAAKAQATTLRELLTSAGERLLHDPPKLAAVRSELTALIGGLQDDLTLPGPAAALWEAEARRLESEGAPLAQRAAAHMEQGNMLFFDDRPSEGWAVLQQAERELDAAGQTDSLLRGRMLYEIGLAAQVAPTLVQRDAQALLEAAVPMLQRHGASPLLLAQARSALSGTFQLQRKPVQAQAMAEQSLAGLAAEQGTRARLLRAQLQLDLGRIYSNAGRYAQADRAVQAALALYEQTVGTDSADAALARMQLGDLHRERYHLHEALPLLTHAREHFRRVSGPEDTLRTAIVDTILGMVHHAAGRPEAARPLLEKALAAQAERKAGSYWHTHALLQWGRLLALQGDESGALPALQSAFEASNTAAWRSSGRQAMVLLDIAELHLQAGRDEAAAENLATAAGVAVADPALAFRIGSRVAELKSRLALTRGDAESAWADATRALAAIDLEYGDPLNLMPLRGALRLVASDAARALGRPDDARAQARAAVELLASQHDALSPWLADARLALAQAELAAGDRAAALALRRQAAEALAPGRALAPHWRERLKSLPA